MHRCKRQTIYSQIPCASDAKKLDVEEPEWRKEQIEENIAAQKIVANARKRQQEEKQKESERIWRENQQLEVQREIILRQNAINNQIRNLNEEMERPKFCFSVGQGHSICN